jgi:CheY-like chemotaxis protein
MLSVLVVDPDASQRGWVRSILEVNGYPVVEAADGYAALACIKCDKPMLVVMEIYLPKLDGLEIITYLNSQALPLKILAISSNPIDGFNACEIARSLGAHDALAKPLDAEMFLKHVRALLSQP